MSAATSIQWTDKTWNPVTGCEKVSPGCAHCYAEGVANRFWASQYPPVEYDTYSVDACCPITEMRPRQFTDVLTHEDRLREPLSWRKPARVFVNSMSDLFHEDVSDAFIDRVFAVMALAQQHTFQILTKRPERMRDYFEYAADYHSRREAIDAILLYADDLGVPIERWPLSNVWLGVSVENQHFADERIPLLLQMPAAVRFISAEPLLGPIDLHSPVLEADSDGYLDWVIVGGESGPAARPFDLAWARAIVEQCKAAGVPVFVKQLGHDPRERNPYGKQHPIDGLAKGGYRLLLRDRKGGDPSEWPVDLRVRQFPATGTSTVVDFAGSGAPRTVNDDTRDKEP